MSNTFGVKLRQRAKVSDGAKRRSNMSDTGARDWNIIDFSPHQRLYAIFRSFIQYLWFLGPASSWAGNNSENWNFKIDRRSK